MSGFTNLRDKVVYEVGSWLIHKLITTLEDKYGRQSEGYPTAPDSAGTTGPADGNDRSTAGQDRGKG